MHSARPAYQQGTGAPRVSLVGRNAVTCVPSQRTSTRQQTITQPRIQIKPLALANGSQDDAFSQQASGTSQGMPGWLSNLMRPATTIPALSVSLIPVAWIGGGGGNWFGGGGGGGGDGGDGGGGASGGDHPMAIADVADDDDDDYEDEEEEEEESGSEEDEEDEEAGEDEEDEVARGVPGAARPEDGGNRFFCAEIVASGLPTGKGAPTEVY